MADTLALGASGATHGGSSPLPGTMIKSIFLNNDLVAVEKPAGLAVHIGIGTKEKTLVDFLLEKYPEIANVGDKPEVRPGIVHRLDKETSGVMIVARNQKSFEYLKNLFKDRKIEKTYHALVHGKIISKEGKIEGEMGRSRRDFRRQALVRGKVSVRNERYSITHYKVTKEFEKYSLLEVYPKTGRMHQIRVHLNSIGHPIVGDEKYAFKEHKKRKYPRMFLHASEISFLSMNNKKIDLKSDLPKEFQGLS
jgi:23S rRNA pseudouridine1911/1915/1917 synthase